MSVLRLIKSDYTAAGLRPSQTLSGVLTLSPFWLIVLHRLSHRLLQGNVPIVPAMLRAVGIVLYGADLSPGACIGPGLHIVHAVGIVVGWDVVAGSGLLIHQNVTLGGRGRIANGRWCPTLGSNVEVGAGAVVLGPIDVGENVSIGANAVVVKSVPDGAHVAGNPARVIHEPT